MASRLWPMGGGQIRDSNPCIGRENEMVEEAHGAGVEMSFFKTQKFSHQAK